MNAPHSRWAVEPPPSNIQTLISYWIILASVQMIERFFSKIQASPAWGSHKKEKWKRKNSIRKKLFWWRQGWGKSFIKLNLSSFLLARWFSVSKQALWTSERAAREENSIATWKLRKALAMTSHEGKAPISGEFFRAKDCDLRHVWVVRRSSFTIWCSVSLVLRMGQTGNFEMDFVRGRRKKLFSSKW